MATHAKPVAVAAAEKSSTVFKADKSKTVINNAEKLTTNINAEKSKTIVNAEKSKTVLNAEKSKTIVNAEKSKTVLNAEKSKTIVNAEKSKTVLNAEKLKTTTISGVANSSNTGVVAEVRPNIAFSEAQKLLQIKWEQEKQQKARDKMLAAKEKERKQLLKWKKVESAKEKHLVKFEEKQKRLRDSSKAQFQPSFKYVVIDTGILTTLAGMQPGLSTVKCHKCHAVGTAKPKSSHPKFGVNLTITYSCSSCKAKLPNITPWQTSSTWKLWDETTNFKAKNKSSQY